VTPAALRLIITHVLSDYSKTIVSSELPQNDAQANTLRLRSDVERKRLFGLTSTAPSQSPPDTGIYTPTAGVLTYHHLHDQAQKLLSAGWSVIVKRVS
jgi:predicted kinase